MVLNKDWAESHFYVLPKIHKSQKILEKIREEPADYIQMPLPDDLKGRPINGDVKSVTRGLSKLLEKILKPMVLQLKTYIKDEFDFVGKIPRNVNDGVYAVSCDVMSLYTKIPTELGIEAIDYWLTKFPNLFPRRFTRSFILEAIRFVLENNYFSFDGEIWHQCTGTAMGKSFAPPYACLTMGYLEETKLFPVLLPDNFDEETTALIISYFFRYIDDGFNFLPKSVMPEVFLNVLNQMNDSIQYTMTEPSAYRRIYMSTDFLSIKVAIDGDGNVKTNIHYKETNAHDYLLFDSHHPEHTKVNIPYTLAKRIYLLTSEGEWVRENLASLKQFLLDRKYPEEIIDRGIHKALLQGPLPEPSEPRRKIPFTSTYFSNHDCRNILNVASDLIGSTRDDRLRQAFKNTQLIQSHRQPKNLLRLLTSSRFLNSSNIIAERKPSGIFLCHRNICKLCTDGYLQECRSFLTSNGTTWDVKCHATCSSKNVIYFLVCNFCNLESYTGKTDNFRNRTNDHISKSRSGKSTNIFDIHVYNCSRNFSPRVPLFKAYIFMVMNDYNKLLNSERQLHLAGHDTMNS